MRVPGLWRECPDVSGGAAPPVGRGGSFAIPSCLCVPEWTGEMRDQPKRQEQVRGHGSWKGIYCCRQEQVRTQCFIQLLCRAVRGIQTVICERGEGVLIQCQCLFLGINMMIENWLQSAYVQIFRGYSYAQLRWENFRYFENEKKSCVLLCQVIPLLIPDVIFLLTSKYPDRVKMQCSQSVLIWALGLHFEGGGGGEYRGGGETRCMLV